MIDNLSPEQDKTAVLIMDYQNDIAGTYPNDVRDELLKRASRVLAKARQKGISVIYVVARFREGCPEVSPSDIARKGIRESVRFGFTGQTLGVIDSF
ncbi:isochorismatase family protein [Chloroflexota bacterium]